MAHSITTGTAPLLDEDGRPTIQSPTKSRYVEFAKYFGFFAAGVVIAVVVAVIINATREDCPSPPGPPPTPAPDNSKFDVMDNTAYYQSIDPHPVNQSDNVRLDRLGSPVMSPDGKWVVFTRTMYRQSDVSSSLTALWLAPTPLEGSWETALETRAFGLTRPQWGASDNSPCWSSDSRNLLFLSNRGDDGIMQLYSLAAPTANPNRFVDAKQVTNFPLDVSNLLLSRTNVIAAFSAEVYKGLDMAATVAKKAAITATRETGMVYDKLFYRHWNVWNDHTRNHPFLLKLDYNADAGWSVASGATPVDVLLLEDTDAPTKPFGGREEWSFSHSGRRFAFTRRQNDSISEVAWSTDLNIYLVDVALSGSQLTITNPLCITCANTATDTGPVFSPYDDGTLVYRAMSVPKYESSKLTVHIWSDNVITPVAPGWNLSVAEVQWGSTNTTLFVAAEERGRVRVFNLSIDNSHEGTYGRLSQNGAINSISVSPDGSFITCSYSTMSSPAAISVLDIKTGTVTTMSDLNAYMLTKLRMGEVTEFNFAGAGGTPIMGWMVKPANFNAANKYPIALLVHGGPQGAWDDGWSYRWNPQVFASADFVILAVNFHGSTGYGQAFTDSIRFDYGGAPYHDNMIALDYAISQWAEFLDPNRIVALGGSYGGFMTFWMAGQTDRFRGLVSHCGIFEWKSFYYSTEELWFPEYDFGTTQYEDPARYEKWNPANFVFNWTTPMLVIHGGRDYRIPEAQGLGAFTALQRRGIPNSKLLYYPNEGHWVTNPINSVQWYRVVLDWITSIVE